MSDNEEKSFKALLAQEDFPNTPMIETNLSDEQKKKDIENYFRKIMETLGLDLDDDSLKDTPKRVAKMYVDEIFSGLDDDKFPKMTMVENKFGSQMVTVSDITFHSSCEHHFVTIAGFAHISYIPKSKENKGFVIGLSKINRIVDYFAKRPQVQERLSEQIAKTLIYFLETDDVAVTIDGVHYCVKARGIRDYSSFTRTCSLHGKFLKDETVRSEYMGSIPAMGEFKLR